MPDTEPNPRPELPAVVLLNCHYFQLQIPDHRCQEMASPGFGGWDNSSYVWWNSLGKSASDFRMDFLVHPHQGTIVRNHGWDRECCTARLRQRNPANGQEFYSSASTF